MLWTPRTSCVLPLSALLLAGCGEDMPPSGPTSEATSTGESSEATSTGQVPETTTGESPSSGTDDPTGLDSTGGPPGVASMVMVINGDLDTPGLNELFRVDYIDGQLSPPLVLNGPTTTNLLPPELSASQRHLFYEAFAVGAPSRYLHLPLDADGNPGLEAPVNLPPAPDGGNFSSLVLNGDESRLYYRGVPAGQGAGPVEIYTAELTADSVVAPSVLVSTNTLGGSLGVAFEVSDDEAWVSFSHEDDITGATDAWIAPADTPAPAAALRISDLDQPWQSAASPHFVPGSEALYYRADASFDGTSELFFVDLSGAQPSTPTRIHPPLPDNVSTNPLYPSRDGGRLAYFVGAAGAGDVWVVSFGDSTVSPPVRLSTLGDAEVWPADTQWSDDGRWLVYSATHEVAGTRDLYLVNMSGAQPSAPMLVAPGGLSAGSDIDGAAFSASGQWLYFVAAYGATVPQLHRVNVQGDVPGAPQLVSGPLPEGGTAVGTIVASHDEQWLTYHAIGGAADARDLYIVDVSGDTPGAPVQVNPSAPQGESVSFDAWFSHDDTAIAYRSYIEATDTHTLDVVDLGALGQAVRVAGDVQAVEVLLLDPA